MLKGEEKRDRQREGEGFRERKGEARGRGILGG